MASQRVFTTTWTKYVTDPDKPDGPKIENPKNFFTALSDEVEAFRDNNPDTQGYVSVVPVSYGSADVGGYGQSGTTLVEAVIVIAYQS